MSSSSSSSPSFYKSHACFIVHGLSATREDMRFVADAIKKERGDDVDIILSKANEGVLYSLFTTTTGVASGGALLAQEVIDFLYLNTHINRISFIAHSNGGNYVRYAVKIIHEKLQEKVEFVNYISFATPHVGVKNFVGNFLNLGLHYVIDGFLQFGLLGQTGRDMITTNDDEQTGVLNRLCYDTLFVNAMKRFKNRTILAANSELLVPFVSAALVESVSRLEELVKEGIVKRHYSKYTSESNEFESTNNKPELNTLKDDKEFSVLSAPINDYSTIKSEFPNIRAVYTQSNKNKLSGLIFIGDDETTSDYTKNISWWESRSGLFGHYGKPDTNLNENRISLPPIEAKLVNKLRTDMSWTTVIVDFDELPAGPIMAHWRIVVSRPYITPVGADIPLFASKHCFIP